MAIVKHRTSSGDKILNREPSPHTVMCERAAKWLRSAAKCNVAVYEVVAWTNEKPDAIGWNPYQSTLVEAKRSRADFKRDMKKYHKRTPDKGMGNLRYYLCPVALLSSDEMPPHYGLLYLHDNGKITVEKRADWQEANLDAERTLLASILRRDIQGCEYMKSRTVKEQQQ